MADSPRWEGVTGERQFPIEVDRGEAVASEASVSSPAALAVYHLGGQASLKTVVLLWLHQGKRIVGTTVSGSPIGLKILPVFLCSNCIIIYPLCSESNSGWIVFHEFLLPIHNFVYIFSVLFKLYPVFTKFCAWHIWISLQKEPICVLIFHTECLWLPHSCRHGPIT